VLSACALPNGPDWTRIIDEDISPQSPVNERKTDSYILTYDLQTYIPIPVEGTVPVKTVTNRRDIDITVVWKNEDDQAIPEPFDTFVLGTVYKADILLSAKNNYAFDQSMSFKYPKGAVTKQPEEDFSLEVRSLTTVTYSWVRAPILIDAGTVNPVDYVPAPAAGETPVRSFGSARYMGTVEWMVGDFTTPMTGNHFGADTDYNAVVSIYAGPGSLFRGIIAAGGILVDGGTNNGASITGIRLDFPPTGRAVVTDRDLTRYIPAPVTGGTPVKQFAVSQYTGTVVWTAGETPQEGEFRIDTAYTAAVTLTAVSGYTFAGMEGGFTHNGADTVTAGETADNAAVRVVTIVFPATTGTITAVTVNDLDLFYKVSAPVTGGTPVTYFPAPQYTGNVAWSPAHGIFQAGMAYTATVTLTAASAYTLDGVSGFTYPGETITTTGNTVTIVFSPTTSVTAVPVDDKNLTLYVPKPVTGGTPVTSFSAPQYWGTVTWDPPDGVFGAGTAYTATVTLTAASGYTLDGVSGFTYPGETITTTGNTVTIVFSATDSVTPVLVTEPDLTKYLSTPATGGTPQNYFYAPQYVGDVEWTISSGSQPLSGLFEAGVSYTATVTLTAASGCTFTGVADDFFTYGSMDISQEDNTGSSITVTIKFPFSSSSGPVITF
jgi:hypothetical protein